MRCKKKGRIMPATVVDHIEPHHGGYDSFWDPGNHQAMCKRCHDIKTATEDGGFGR
jgi:5-methylcytosine-specific restriction protein A